MGLRDELLKAIWHAFTALDVDKSGKVSKSQLKVLSHNLCTVMKIPHDPVSLEEHFRDDDEGPVSNQGYMPYLNRFILDKVQDNFDRIDFNRMCWTLCARKNLNRNHLLISDDDAFKIWCIFNFLSEDRYPLVMVSEEIEYFLRKQTEAMGGSWIEEKFEEYKLQLSSKHQCLNVWELIELVGMGHFSKGMDRQTLSMGINEVFQELILDVLKQGYMMKKGHKRKNWTERWFLLKPNLISYYASEDLTEKKGDILLDGNCCVESLPDKEGKKCLFYVKCSDKSFEISASDKKKKQEWIQASSLNPVQHDMYLISLQMKSVFVLHRNWRRPQPMQQKKNADVCRPRASCKIFTGWKWIKRKWLLEEEVSKRAELEQIHLYQQETISQTQAEKQELERERLAKESALQSAMQQLQQLEADRRGALEQYEEVMKKLADAANNTKSWKDKVVYHEGLMRLIQPGPKHPQKITNWGPAAFTEKELSLREKDWQEKKNRPPTPQ
ncbi:hypothetical protein cypCar_00003342 [Cyprinus carpio]|nr:hypothetical protein cypCar_00003342 [Cyprinus carpio]